MEFVGIACVVAEGGGDLVDVFVQSNGIGFAVVPRFNCGKGLGVGID